jgi:hypothetical protein
LIVNANEAGKEDTQYFDDGYFKEMLQSCHPPGVAGAIGGPIV